MTFPNKFEDIQISTHVFVASMDSITIDLDKLFNQLPIHQVNIPVYIKKKEFEQYVLDMKLKSGTCLRIRHNSKLRGARYLKKQKADKKQKFFRNSITIDMVLKDKLVNFKVPTKGKIQLTGCKTEEHAIECIKYFWDILQTLPDVYTMTGKELYIVLQMVLTNKNFKCGFLINRQNLDQYINLHTEYNSLLELSVGYTGVNIKVPFECKNTPITTLKWNSESGWSKGIIMYDDYVNGLAEKDKVKELRKKRYNTFLVFHSGTAIMSGMTPEYMKQAYNEFTSIIQLARDNIEESLVEHIF